MRKIGFLLVTLLFLKVNTGSAAIVTFFGEDLNSTGDPNVATPFKSYVASGQFFANLANVGTETFEGFPTGRFVPFNVDFSGLGSAFLSGTGTVVSGNDGAGRFPISGTQYLLTDAGEGFNLRFSSPVSAFGFFGTDIGDYGGQLVLTLTDVNGQLTTLPVPNTIVSNGSTSGSVLFYGFLDTANRYINIQFSDVQSADSPISDRFAFDNLTAGSVTPAAPEPGAFALMGLGMISLFGFCKLKRNRTNKNANQ